MTLNQNINELNVFTKNGSKAHLDKINIFIDLYDERKLVKFATAKHLVVELAHPTGSEKKRSEICIIIFIAKYIKGEPSTRHIARQIHAQQQNTSSLSN